VPGGAGRWLGQFRSTSLSGASCAELAPSTTSTWPLMYDAPGAERNATAAATSSAVPGRPTGVARPILISCSGEEAVAIQPGATALTVVPRRPTSTASARVSPVIPALAAWYAASPG
jgi:hypothetical protein